MIKEILLALLLIGAGGFLMLAIACMFKDLNDKEMEHYRDEEI